MMFVAFIPAPLVETMFPVRMEAGPLLRPPLLQGVEDLTPLSDVALLPFLLVQGLEHSIYHWVKPIARPRAYN